MKNTGTCPKCKSKDIIRVFEDSRPYGAGDNIQIGLWIIDTIQITRYICGKCGFVEEWIDLPADIKQLKDKFGPTGN